MIRVFGRNQNDGFWLVMKVKTLVHVIKVVVVVVCKRK